MKIAVFCAVFLALIGTLCAQEVPTASYPVSLISGAKALPIGTHVWVNLGDGPCTYPGARDARKSWWPIGNRKCFGNEYRKGVIKEVFYFRGWEFGSPGMVYKVEYVDLPYKAVGEEKLTRNAYLDDACKFVNLPADLAGWSQYIIRMNW